MEHSIKIYQYPFPLRKGDILKDGPSNSGGQSFEPESETLFTWVDLMPTAKFAHPTAYVFISASHTEVIKGMWWPILNGRRILLGENNFIGIISPIELAGFLANEITDKKSQEDKTLDFQDRTKPVLSIEQVILTKIETNPSMLLINTVGTVNSTGWRNPRLSQYIYVMPPSDNIWEFGFYADEPSGIISPLIAPIQASFMLHSQIGKESRLSLRLTLK